MRVGLTRYSHFSNKAITLITKKRQQNRVRFQIKPSKPQSTKIGNTTRALKTNFAVSCLIVDSVNPPFG